MNRIVELSVAAAIVAATPSMATAQGVAYSRSPVSVMSCSVDESYAAWLPSEEGGGQEFAARNITLTFVNKSNVAATAVKILLNDGRYTQSLFDKGTFAPGVPIEHNFAADSGVSARRNAICDVAEVGFGDGSAWLAAPRALVKR